MHEWTQGQASLPLVPRMSQVDGWRLPVRSICRHLFEIEWVTVPVSEDIRRQLGSKEGLDNRHPHAMWCQWWVLTWTTPDHHTRLLNA